MPVVGLNIRNINARKTQEITGPVKVNNTTNFVEIKEHKLEALDKTGLSISFAFKAEYTTENSKKSIAEIEINGDVFFLDAEHETILKGWKKDKKLPDDVNIQIINTILRKCITKAIDLSEELQLPPPVALPFAQQKKQEESGSRYIG
jgi:hypothetical protein